MKITLFIYTDEYRRTDHFTVPDDADREEIMREARNRIGHFNIKPPVWVDVYAGKTKIGNILGVAL